MLGNQQEQAAVAQAAFTDAGQGWAGVELHYVSQAGVAMLDFIKVGADGSRELLFDYSADLPYEELRRAMVDDHGAWISSRMLLSPEGAFRFTFNYDEREDWLDGRQILDESWVTDMVRHPRPWAEIPDWHPVKAQFDEQGWAQELARRASES